MLKPLTEWICDACGETIEAPEYGYVEWQMAGSKKFGFRIVHHATRSPRRNNGGNCYYTTSERGGDMSLDRVVGPIGLAVLTSWLDIGSFHESVFSGPSVLDIREWVTLFRRLHLPYYEEARLCTDELCGELDDGVNEIYLYLPNTLRHVIERHESKTSHAELR